MLYKDSATMLHSLNGNTVQYYINHVLLNHRWATYCEISAACEILKLNIDIWLKGFVLNRNLEREERFNQPV